MNSTKNTVLYDVVSNLIESAAKLAAHRNSPVVETEDSYRVHKRYIISTIMDMQFKTTEELDFIINTLFHKQAEFDPQTLWITIFKAK